MDETTGWHQSNNCQGAFPTCIWTAQIGLRHQGEHTAWSLVFLKNLDLNQFLSVSQYTLMIQKANITCMDIPSEPLSGNRPGLAGLKCLMVAVAWLVQACFTQGAEQASQSPPAATAGITEAGPAKVDVAAGMFLGRCSGCHSLSGAKLTGPELSHVATWDDETLRQAIKRMENNVGPLAAEQVADLSNLLRAPGARDRLKVEEARVQVQFMAQMEPANAVIGKALFRGSRALANGGVSCFSCHTVAGQGGNLGPELTGVFAKMGKTSLISAIEKASFKIMGPHYQDRPVTRQEAMHLAEFLSQADPRTAAPSKASFAWAGAGIAVCLLASLRMYFQSRRTGRDQHLMRRR